MIVHFSFFAFFISFFRPCHSPLSFAPSLTGGTQFAAYNLVDFSVISNTIATMSRHVSFSLFIKHANRKGRINLFVSDFEFPFDRRFSRMFRFFFVKFAKLTKSPFKFRIIKARKRHWKKPQKTCLFVFNTQLFGEKMFLWNKKKMFIWKEVYWIHIVILRNRDVCNETNYMTMGHHKSMEQNKLWSDC